MNVELLKLQAEYKNQHKDRLDPLPPYWFDVDNDKLKIEVLKRAIAENKLIIDVKGGNNFVEEVIL